MPNQKERELKVRAACILRINGFTIAEIAKVLGMANADVRPISREVKKKVTVSHF